MSKDVHLVVLQHGLWGNPKQLGNLEATLNAVLADKGPTKVVNCSANVGMLTYDGVDVCGDRMVELVKQLTQVSPAAPGA
jgi:hypothetical protein